MLGRTGDQSEARRTQAASAASLRVALVGPTGPGAGRLGPHTVELAHRLGQAGHDVTLVSWSAAPSGPGAAAEDFPDTVRALARNRPDTWLRAGRRLRGYDALVLVHTGAAMVPLQVALLRGAGIGGRRAGAAVQGPRSVLLCDAVLPDRPGAAARTLVSTILGRVHGVLVHRHEEAPLAARLGAARVYAVERPDSLGARRASAALGRRPGLVSAEGTRIPALATTSVTPVFPVPSPARGAGGRGAGSGGGTGDTASTGLSAPWAAYVGAIEALAAQVPAADVGDPETGEDRPPAGSRAARLAATAVQRAAGAKAAAGRLSRSLRPTVELKRADLPDWVRPTDVLDDGWQADEARDEARRLGLPRVRDGIAAWAALGALAAVVRVADNGRRAAVLVDESGPEAPLSRWARACGFAPVDLGLTVPGGSPSGRRGCAALDVDPGSLDVVARVHPGGCDASDVDEAFSQAAWALRPGGLLVVTLPLGRAGTDLALSPADVRAAVARAGEHGFVLVGDVDGEVGRRMRAAGRAAEGSAARTEGAAYGLVRLTLRRR